MIFHCNSGKNKDFYQKYQEPASCYFMEEAILSLCWNTAVQCQKAVTGMEAGDHLFSSVLCEQRGLQEENKGIEMGHFHPPELDFLWKTIRRVRGSGNHTYSCVVWPSFQMSHITFPTGRASLEEKRHWSVRQVFHHQLPGVVSAMWSCWDHQPASGAERDGLAVLVLLPCSRRAAAGSLLPWTALQGSHSPG